jgi:hypothetical protein
MYPNIRCDGYFANFFWKLKASSGSAMENEPGSTVGFMTSMDADGLARQLM